MRTLSPDELEARARAYPKGRRVKVRRLAVTPGGIDDNENLPPGTCGMITGPPDAAGSIPARWDGGGTLQFLVEDDVELLPEEAP